jgi:hypothetical protein
MTQGMVDDGEVELPGLLAEMCAADDDLEPPPDVAPLVMHDRATGRRLSSLEVDAVLAARTGDADTAARYRALAVHYRQAPADTLETPPDAVLGEPPVEGP